MIGHVTTAEEDFAHSFDDELTEDAITVTLGLGGEHLEMWLFSESLWQSVKEDASVGPDTRLEETIGRLRRAAHDPDLKKKAEQIILRGIAGLACGYKVNGLVRLSILEWCRRRDEGKAGNPGLGPIERLFRAITAERIIKEGNNTRAKKLVTKIMREVGIKERSAMHLKKKAECRGRRTAPGH